MILFCQEKQLNPFNGCAFLASFLKGSFSKCHSIPRDFPVPWAEAEEQGIDFDEEDDQVFVSAIISKYMEAKCKRKSMIGTDAFRWAQSPKAVQIQSSCDGKRGLPRCSSATSFDAFFSVKTHFSRSSSLNKIDFLEFCKGSVIPEFFQCEGCGRALLLPPLPKSPSDSWSWSSIHRMRGALHQV